MQAILSDNEFEAAAEAALTANTVGVPVNGERVVLTDVQCDAALARWRSTGRPITECLYTVAAHEAADQHARRMQREAYSQRRTAGSYEHLYRSHRRKSSTEGTDTALFIIMMLMVFVAAIIIVGSSHPREAARTTYSSERGQHDRGWLLPD